jgi:hypothetical protein
MASFLLVLGDFEIGETQVPQNKNVPSGILCDSNVELSIASGSPVISIESED